MFDKIKKQLKNVARGSSSRRRRYGGGSSSNRRYHNFRSSSSSSRRHKYNPMSGSKRYKRRSWGSS